MAAWELPVPCLMRMFEFSTVREEYVETFKHEPLSRQRDHSQRLTLEDIVELAAINSREYQTQKENLYRVALSLSLQRFDHQMKFTSGVTGANYSDNRNGGETTYRANHFGFRPAKTLITR